ncbi:MAG TPA: hypothetical protein ENK18_15115 [Deltaproteobacteria bacterium]|nr:hypothetical protein [Deltaproteobacteria bacterium]
MQRRPVLGEAAFRFLERAQTANTHEGAYLAYQCFSDLYAIWRKSDTPPTGEQERELQRARQHVARRLGALRSAV